MNSTDYTSLIEDILMGQQVINDSDGDGIDN